MRMYIKCIYNNYKLYIYIYIYYIALYIQYIICSFVHQWIMHAYMCVNRQWFTPRIMQHPIWQNFARWVGFCQISGKSRVLSDIRQNFARWGILPDDPLIWQNFARWKLFATCGNRLPDRMVWDIILWYIWRCGAGHNQEVWKKRNADPSNTGMSYCLCVLLDPTKIS